MVFKKEGVSYEVKFSLGFFKRRSVRFFKDAGSLVKGIMGAAITVVVCVVIDTEVLPIIINGSDGGIGEATLPILQAGLLISAIFAAIGIIYFAARTSFGGEK